ncbi:GNAT family N-acetyltransferase [Pengzhenrongella frigida]|uniref:N-acetyltransferase n=1 Tax=Pengzhenrongella frigida TaxID=1259133 RepID=A0A4Q5MZL2_9MICO|nr:GNAT family N-acetyltransferase [Cellulomonas sp. HLT2-17]RYV51302.1 N-acetyltransferase [Cellulomonas sp. HLT2-17]
MDAASATITARDNAVAQRYELVDDGRVIGQTQYVAFDAESGPQRIFFHTSVDEEYGGRGLASMLAAFALQDTVSAGMKIVPVCSYIRGYIGRNPDLAGHTVEVEPAHLAAVPED